jgi:catechol 2,3-dioxygenase-like lactoylglutathione lyase family enzyme
MITAYRHTGVNVTHLGRAIDFYCDLLGLTLVERRTEQGRYIDGLTGLEGVLLHWAKVGSPDGILIELVQFASKKHIKPSKRRDYATIGCNHLCFTIQGIEKLYAKLTEAGVRCHPIQQDPPGKVRNMVCYDPDGTIIELVEPL